MTTPTTMTTSTITTATIMMTGAVVALSLGGLMVGSVLLLTGRVPIVVVVPSVCEGKVVSTVCEGEVVSTVWEGEVVPTVWGGEVVSTVWEGEVVPTVWEGEVVPTVWEGEVFPTVWEGVVPLEIDAVGMKYTGSIAFQMDRNTTHITLKHVKFINPSIILLFNGTQTRYNHKDYKSLHTRLVNLCVLCSSHKGYCKLKELEH